MHALQKTINSTAKYHIPQRTEENFDTRSQLYVPKLDAYEEVHLMVDKKRLSDHLQTHNAKLNLDMHLRSSNNIKTAKDGHI